MNESRKVYLQFMLSAWIFVILSWAFMSLFY